MKRADPIITFGLFIASFVLYIRTLAPSLLFGDSAELQTIAHTLGMGHPTGYPIYILLTKLFTFIPFGDVAYRVNLFSAFCAALTVGLVYLILRTLGAMYAAALYGSLTLALTPLFWKYASIAEVYAPSAAWLALILLLVLQWKQINNPRWLFGAGLLGGLSLGLHTTVAFSGLAVLLYLVVSTHQRSDWLQALLGAAAGVIIFLSAFLFLDVQDAAAGYYNTVVRPSLSVWGMTSADFDSPFERLAFLYFPPQFKGQFFSVSREEVRFRLEDFGIEARSRVWLALIGFISLLIPRKDSYTRWREAILLIVALTTFLTFATTYNVFDFRAYYVPAILILSIFVGLGVNAIMIATTLITTLPRFAPVALGIAILAVGFYPFLSDVAFHWKERVPPALEDWEGYFFKFPEARKLEAQKIVNRLEEDAIVFTDWDRAYDFYYVAHVLQERTEMDFHEAFPQEGETRFAESAIAYIEANIDNRPIYFSERPSQLSSRYKITRAGSGLVRIERK